MTIALRGYTLTRTHFQKIFSDILARKGRTMLVSVSIFIGVLGVITLFSVRDLIAQQLDEDVRPEQLAMIDIQVTANEGFDNADTLEKLRILPSTIAVEGQVEVPIRFKKPSDAEFQEAELRAYSVNLEDLAIEPMRLLEGEFPIEGQNELVLEKRMAEQYGFALDDTIVLKGLGENTITAEEISYTVVGIVFHPYSYRAPSNFGGFTPGPADGIYVQFADAGHIRNIAEFSTIVARYENFSDAETNFAEFQRIIAEDTNYEVVVPQLEDPENNQQVLNAENFNNVLTMLSFVAMLVSGSLVINVVNAIVIEQKRQIGSMKAIGASSADIFKIYIGISMSYGIIGTTLAILPAIWLGNVAAQGLAPQLDVLLTGFDWSPPAVVIGVLLGIVVPALSALIPVFNAVRVNILDAITDLGITGGSGASGVTALINALPVPMTLRQALNNINRKKGRLALTGFTLTMAIAAFMGVTAVGASLTNVIDEVFLRIQYQILVVPDKFTRPEETGANIETTEGVAIAHIGSLVAVEMPDGYLNFFTQDNQIVIFGIDPTRDVILYDLEDGQTLDKVPNQEGAIISMTLAEQLDLGVGDDLIFTAYGTDLHIPIVGVDKISFDAIWMQWEFLSRTVGFVNPLTDEPVANGYYVEVSQENPSVEEVDIIIEDISTTLAQEGINIQFARNQVEQRIESNRLISQNISILNLAATLIAMVGAIGLLTSLAMNVFERQKEIGVMRSMGGSSGIIVSQFLLEGLVVGFVAWFLAIPLSYGIALGVNASLGLDAFKFTYPPEVIVIGFVGMMVIAALASIGPALGAARKTVSEILRYQ